MNHWQMAHDFVDILLLRLLFDNPFKINCVGFLSLESRKDSGPCGKRVIKLAFNRAKKRG